MRLIDADDFKKFMQALCKAGSPYESFIELLDKQTTAYDIDKVVEEFEENSSRYTKKYTTPYGNNGYKDTKAISVNKAIEIVKHGGVSDDVCEWKLDGDNLMTGCGDYFNLYDNCTGKFKYCARCGKKIKVVE